MAADRQYPASPAPTDPLTPEELDRLRKDPYACRQGRRTFVKWSALLGSQAVLAGGVLDLVTGRPALADDKFDDVAQWVHSVCGFCAVGCGLEIGVNAVGRAIAVKGNASHPTNAGHVCVKGLYEYKALNDADLRVGKRAVNPLRRNAAGGWDRITWDEATTLLAQKIAEAVAARGPDSVGIYNTGQWTLEEYYSMGKLGKAAIGTRSMDSNTRLCMAAAVYGYMSTFGSDGPPGCYEDIENADCLFLIGTNPADMHPNVWCRIIDARRTSPFRFYQYWLNTPDDDVIRYLKYFTLLDREQIAELGRAVETEPHRRLAQRTLAEEVTRMVHGEAALRKAEAATAGVVRERRLAGLRAADLLDIFAEVPSSSVPRGALEGEGALVVDLAAQAGLDRSKKQIRNLIQSGGLYVNDERVEDVYEKVGLDDAVDGRVIVLRKGKKSYHLVRVEG